MGKLTEQQRRFADEYIRLGKPGQAAINAGYSKSTAQAQSKRMLENVGVKAYIDKRLDELKKESIAEQDEVMQYLTSVMRGEYTEQTLKGVGEGAQEITEIDVAANQRIRAAELLGKRYGIWTDRHEVENRGAVTIVNNTSEMRRRMEDAAGDSD